MVAVPAPIRQLFDTFPLATYPPVPSSTPQRDEDIESRKFYFQGPSTSHHFTLAVHNVITLERQPSKIVPSDPVSLGQALILCHKNKLKLPQKNGTADQSSNAIVTVSFHASPDNELPLLIEDHKEQRNVRTYSSINHTIASKNFSGADPELIAINNLVDTKLYDLWVLALLGEDSGPETFHQLFNFSGAVGKLESLDFYQELPQWQAFKTRHPGLFDQDHISLKNGAFSRIQNFYDMEAAAFSKTLDLLIEFLADEPDSLQRTIIELKIAGYVIVFSQILSSTKVGQVVLEKPAFVKKCNEIIERY